jgi:hypothetical protein
MPGFLGGSTGGTGTGGEILFPKEFVDPVTKLRVSQPENLIDTDFEYGLQPTKWETVELINNTPSFFSKSGDTTIPGIIAITTNDGTREITVSTALDHGLAPGIPINVTGTKSVTADGSYIINSIPSATIFTYLCRDNQNGDNSIEDLYTSIITGEFFQGSQIRLSSAEGIITDGEAQSTLTVNTESTHGFGVNTPFYFLNLNSTISQEFEAANTAAKSFDSSNSATAQTFDGSNTLSSFNIDWSNSATVGGTVSTITNVSTVNNTITVSHTTESFLALTLGQPLYYDVTTSSGYFANNPRGVVFLKSTTSLGGVNSTSTFQVSAVPDGDVIVIEASMAGTFQVANQARAFAGNNSDALTQITVPVVIEAANAFEGANDGGPQSGGLYANGNPLSTVASYSGSLVNVTVTAGAGLGYYTGAMVLYSTTGSAASGLTNNTTYFIDSFFATGTDTFAFTIKALPTSASPITISGGTGTQTFSRIGVSLDKDIWHIRNSNYLKGDMLEYSFPEDGAVTDDTTKTFFFVDLAYDSHNYLLSDSLFSATSATGGAISQTTVQGQTFNVHTFTTVGTTNFVVSSIGTEPYVEYLIVAGGGGGGMDMGGGGGGGGVLTGIVNLSSATTYPVVVGAEGNGAPRAGFGAGTQGIANHVYTITGTNGGNSSWNGLVALGGGRGGMAPYGQSNVRGAGATGGSGGGATGYDIPDNVGGAAGTPGQGFAGGNASGNYWSGGGGGAGGVGGKGAFSRAPFGGIGRFSMIDGNPRFYGGGGGGSGYSGIGGDGGYGGGGAGSVQDTFGGIYARNNGTNNSAGEINSQTNQPGRNAGANTGGGGGGGSHYNSNNQGGQGGSGIVILRYPTIPRPTITPTVATGGDSVTTVAIGKINYRVHQFTTVGTSSFTVTNQGSAPIEYLVVAGGGGGGTQHSGGGGAGGYRCSVPGESSGRLTAAEAPLVLPAATYTVVVGAGGAGAPANAAQGVNGFRGGNSQFHTITSIGGGGGGSWAADNGSDRRSGGSGGGGRADGSSWAGGAGTAGQGFDGGFSNATPSQPHVGAGGGGAGSVGEANIPGRTVRVAGRGGHGICSNITGTPTIRGAGGGGGAYWSSGQQEPSRAYARQNSGGGDGGRSFQSNGAAEASGGNGTNGTGGGGGCAGQYERTGGTGGSGIVIVRYPIGYVD